MNSHLAATDAIFDSPFFVAAIVVLLVIALVAFTRGIQRILTRQVDLWPGIKFSGPGALIWGICVCAGALLMVAIAVVLILLKIAYS